MIDSSKLLAQSREMAVELEMVVEKIHQGYLSRSLEFTGAPLGEAFEEDRIADRRSATRRSASIPFYLTELDKNGHRIDGSQMLALTRDLSPRGLGIQADQPITTGFYEIEFDCIRSEVIRLLIEIRWTQKKSRHCYYAGAKIHSQLDIQS